jgi:hypothetical protein
MNFVFSPIFVVFNIFILTTYKPVNYFLFLFTALSRILSFSYPMYCIFTLILETNFNLVIFKLKCKKIVIILFTASSICLEILSPHLLHCKNILQRFASLKIWHSYWQTYYSILLNNSVLSLSYFLINWSSIHDLMIYILNVLIILSRQHNDARQRKQN